MSIIGNLNFVENIVEEKLMALNTAYLGRVLSINGRTAKIQPLGKVKAYGEEARSQSPLSNVPILRSAGSIYVGDIALCVCCDRDITEAKKGNNTTPVAGHHSKSSSIVVGVL